MRPNSNCRSCAAPIRWVITEPNGRLMPLDPEPVDDGNVWVVGNKAGTPIVAVALSGDGVPASEALRYVSHFVSCPDAEEWRHDR